MYELQQMRQAVCAKKIVRQAPDVRIVDRIVGFDATVMAVGSPGLSSTIGAAPAVAWLLGLDKAPVGRFGSAVVHIPERSGLPSVNRGVGAAMFTLPSAFRGTPTVGYAIH